MIFDFLLTAGAIWVMCFALGLLGVTVVFSWKMTFAIWLIIAVIRVLFSKKG